MRLLAAVGDEPVVFAGPPGALRGLVPLANDSDSRQTLREVQVEVGTVATVRAPMVVRLAPGARASNRTTLRVDPATPAGVYEGRVTVGDDSAPARIVVLEHASLALSPDSALVTDPAVPITVVVHNRGNVALHLAAVVKADLEGDADRGTVLGRLPEPVDVVPGAMAALSLTIELPADLDPARRHVVLLPIGPADLEVVVLPRDPVLSPTIPRPPAKRTPGTTRRAT